MIIRPNRSKDSRVDCEEKHSSRIAKYVTHMYVMCSLSRFGPIRVAACGCSLECPSAAREQAGERVRQGEMMPHKLGERKASRPPSTAGGNER